MESHTTKHSLSFSPFFITSQYGEITGEGAQSDEQMDNGEAQDAFGPDCVFPLGISSRIVTDRCLLMSVKRHRNVCTGVKMWWKSWRRSWVKSKIVCGGIVWVMSSQSSWKHNSWFERWSEPIGSFTRSLGAPYSWVGWSDIGRGRSEHWWRWSWFCVVHRRK